MREIIGRVGQAGLLLGDPVVVSQYAARPDGARHLRLTSHGAVVTLDEDGVHELLIILMRWNLHIDPPARSEP